jgi:type I restriction enzyme S subunit
MTGSIFDVPKTPGLRSDWVCRSLRGILQTRSERNCPDLPLLTVARERGVFIRSSDDDNHNAIPEDLSNYKVARCGDLVINKMKAWQGSLGLAPVDGIVSPAYFVFVADFAVPRFGEYLLRSKPLVSKFAAASDGVRVGQWDLNISRMRNIQVNLPPADEQAAIVKYLAHANARVEKAIAAKRRLIELLQQQKNAISRSFISEAVSAAPTRVASGYEWLGDVPSNWVRYRAKAILCDIDVRSETGSEEVLSVSHITGVTPRSEKQITMFEAASYVGHKLCEPGDLVVNTMWAWMGALGASRYRGIVSPAYNVYRPRSSRKIDPDFLAYLLRSQQYNDMFRMYSTGIRPSRLRFYPDQMLALPLFLPPLEEQRRIVQKIIGASTEVDRTVARINREIDLLQEFRVRLVADVVTGQVDIRNVAATLPEVQPTAQGVHSHSGRDIESTDLYEEFADLIEDGRGLMT